MPNEHVPCEVADRHRLPGGKAPDRHQRLILLSRQTRAIRLDLGECKKPAKFVAKSRDGLVVHARGAAGCRSLAGPAWTAPSSGRGRPCRFRIARCNDFGIKLRGPSPASARYLWTAAHPSHAKISRA